jgi:hypothetical protein
MYVKGFPRYVQAIRINRPNSKFAQHILDTQHTHDTVEETTDILHIKKKEPPTKSMLLHA